MSTENTGAVAASTNAQKSANAQAAAGRHTNEELFEASRWVIPGGVDSPVRAFGSVGGTPKFIASAQGATVTDVEGTEYVDLVGSWGPALLGHAHPAVVEAVQRAAARGLSFGAPTAGEAELASTVINRVARAGVHPVEKVRFVSTGTEATMTAIRLARGATGRDVIVKFSGLYHGHSDSLLAEAGSGLATFGLPASAGVPEAISALTIVLPYNDLDAVRELFAARGEQIAGVIVESSPSNMGVVPPLPGFNAGLIEIAHAHGALVIYDEVLTGFRVTEAGYWGYENGGAEHPYVPDLITFGKVIGGGLPIAALGGRAELLDLLAPTGPVYQAGTLSGNPLAVAGGLTTLQLADAEVYAKVDAASVAVRDAISEALDAAGVAHRIQHSGSLFSVAFGEFDGPLTDYAQVKASQTWRYPAFFHALLDGGVAAPPSAFESWFVSAAHDADVVDRIVSALPAAAQAAAAVPEPRD